MRRPRIFMIPEQPSAAEDQAVGIVKGLARFADLLQADAFKASSLT
jgi:hypothetical protein